MDLLPRWGDAPLERLAEQVARSLHRWMLSDPRVLASWLVCYARPRRERAVRPSLRPADMPSC